MSAETKENADFQLIEDDVDSVVFPQIGKTIVIDTGTYNIRMGVAGDTEPLHITDTVDFATIKSQKQQPVIQGKVENWDYISGKWLKLIENELHFDTDSHAIILNEPYYVSKPDREKMTEILFESILTPAFYVSPSSLYALYSTGRTSGCVLDIGYDCTRVVPIYEGYVLQLNAAKMDIGGQHMSSALANNLEKHYKVSQIKSFNLDILEDVKRRCLSVNEFGDDVKYKLPDNTVLTIEYEKCIADCCDALFHGHRLLKCLYSSILKCDKSSYDEMFGNVITCGGTSMIDGLNSRIKQDLISQVELEEPEQQPTLVHVASPKQKQLATWTGASIFSSLSSFSRALITIKEYEECGARIVHHKCF